MYLQNNNVIFYLQQSNWLNIKFYKKTIKKSLFLVTTAEILYSRKFLCYISIMNSIKKGEKMKIKKILLVGILTNCLTLSLFAMHEVEFKLEKPDANEPNTFSDFPRRSFFEPPRRGDSFISVGPDDTNPAPKPINSAFDDSLPAVPKPILTEETPLSAKDIESLEALNRDTRLNSSKYRSRIEPLDLDVMSPEAKAKRVKKILTDLYTKYFKQDIMDELSKQKKPRTLNKIPQKEFSDFLESLPDSDFMTNEGTDRFKAQVEEEMKSLMEKYYPKEDTPIKPTAPETPLTDKYLEAMKKKLKKTSGIDSINFPSLDTMTPQEKLLTTKTTLKDHSIFMFRKELDKEFKTFPSSEKYDAMDFFLVEFKSFFDALPKKDFETEEGVLRIMDKLKIEQDRIIQEVKKKLRRQKKRWFFKLTPARFKK
jgi:hypothetical protein